MTTNTKIVWAGRPNQQASRLRSPELRGHVFGENAKTLSTNSFFHFRLLPMPASKDNIKAFFIIAFYLALLVGLLVTANHFRPHP